MAPKTPKSAWIETDTGNRISRHAHLHGTQNIILGGRCVISPHCTIRGDLTPTRPAPAPSSSSSSGPQPNPSIIIGRYTYISAGAVLRPPSRLHRGQVSYHPLKIGDSVFVGEGAVVEAASLGNGVCVEKGAVVGMLCVVKEGVRVLEGSVLAGGMVVPAGAVVGGRPARILGDVGEGWEGVDCRELWRGVDMKK